MVKFVAAALVGSLSTASSIPPPTLGDPAEMANEDRTASAMTLYQQGAALLEDGKALEAMHKYEEAYHQYAPDRHVFNYNIGWAAFEAGQCDAAAEAFQAFLDLVADHELRGSAQEQMLAIQRGQCQDATVPTGATTTTTAANGATATPPATTLPPPSDVYDGPPLESEETKRKKQIEIERATADDAKKSGMLIGGAVATAVGGLGLIGGAISLGLANKKANDLADLASPGPTGFPNGDYGSDNVFDLDRNKLPANNAATIALFAGGGVLTAVGVTLITLDVRKRKNGGRALDDNANTPSKGATAKRRRVRLRGLAATPTRRGLTASATVAF